MYIPFLFLTKRSEIEKTKNTRKRLKKQLPKKLFEKEQALQQC
jgi:hypothetical protein